MKGMKLFVSITAIFLIAGCASVQIPHEQLEGIRSAAARVLPPEAKVEVTTESCFLSRPALIISAHLLEGHSSDETSPYVQGDYGTHEKLTRLVSYRCAKILRSVATESQIPDVSKIVIQSRHGVRQYVVTQPYSGFPAGGGTDVAMTIYTVSVPIDSMKGRGWSSMDEERIMQLWTVDMNIIPSLHFQEVRF